MIAFLTAWGFFWFLLWLAGSVLGMWIKEENILGLSLFMLGVSSIFLIAVGIGAMVSAAQSC